MQPTIPPDNQARHMLDAVLRDLPALPEPDAGLIDTAGLLIHLADRWPGPPAERERGDLHRLCRQIAVPKRVLRFYPADNRKAAQGELLPSPFWALLIAVLLIHAERWPDEDPLSRGLTLKCLNGALQALDIADGFAGRAPLVACPPVPHVPHLAALRSWAERVTERVCSENSG